MITIAFEDKTYKKECSVAFDDNEACVAEIVRGLVEVCEFAGYSARSFDYLIREAVMQTGGELKNYLINREY